MYSISRETRDVLDDILGKTPSLPYTGEKYWEKEVHRMQILRNSVDCVMFALEWRAAGGGPSAKRRNAEPVHDRANSENIISRMDRCKEECVSILKTVTSISDDYDAYNASFVSSILPRKTFQNRRGVICRSIQTVEELLVETVPHIRSVFTARGL